MSENLFEYKFVNNSTKGYSFFGPDNKNYVMKPGSSLVVKLDSTTPVAIKADLARARKIFVVIEDLVSTIKAVNNQLKSVNGWYEYFVEEPVIKEEIIEVPVEEPEEAGPIIFSVTKFIPVMYVGDTQKVVVETEGLLGKTTLVSSDSGVAKTRGLTVTALSAGSAQIEVKNGDFSKVLLLEIRDKE